MRCLLAGLCVVGLLTGPVAWGQTSGVSAGGDNGVTLADQPPADNVRGGAVWQRAPGRIVEAALARHRALADLRLAAQRTGETSALAPEPDAAGALNSSLSSLLGGSLSSVLNTFLNSGLAGALGGQTAGSGSTGDASGTDFSNLPPEVLQMLADAGISLSDLNQKQKEDSLADSVSLPKSSSRAQTSGQQEERRFVARWADAMLSTFFTAATVAFQTPDFIDLLKDAFRPFLFPQSGTDEGDGSGSDGGQGGDTGDGGGGGGGGLI